MYKVQVSLKNPILEKYQNKKVNYLTEISELKYNISWSIDRPTQRNLIIIVAKFIYTRNRRHITIKLLEIRSDSFIVARY